MIILCPSVMPSIQGFHIALHSLSHTTAQCSRKLFFSFYSRVNWVIGASCEIYNQIQVQIPIPSPTHFTVQGFLHFPLRYLILATGLEDTGLIWCGNFYDPRYSTWHNNIWIMQLWVVGVIYYQVCCNYYLLRIVSCRGHFLLSCSGF